MLIPTRAADTVHQDAPAAARQLRCTDSSGVGRAVTVPPWLPHPTARGAKPRQTGAGDGTLIRIFHPKWNRKQLQNWTKVALRLHPAALGMREGGGSV